MEVYLVNVKERLKEMAMGVGVKRKHSVGLWNDLTQTYFQLRDDKKVAEIKAQLGFDIYHGIQYLWDIYPHQVGMLIFPLELPIVRCYGQPIPEWAGHPESYGLELASWCREKYIFPVILYPVYESPNRVLWLKRMSDLIGFHLTPYPETDEQWLKIFELGEEKDKVLYKKELLNKLC